MSRDPKRLKVFEMADTLVVGVYRLTRHLPVEERFGLQSQIRRAAVSVPANIVEGCSRASTRDYLHFMTIALGSASEAAYLIDLAMRLEFVPAKSASALVQTYDQLKRSLQALIANLGSLARSPKPEA